MPVTRKVSCTPVGRRAEPPKGVIEPPEEVPPFGSVFPSLGEVFPEVRIGRKPAVEGCPVNADGRSHPAMMIAATNHTEDHLPEDGLFVRRDASFQRRREGEDCSQSTLDILCVMR